MTASRFSPICAVNAVHVAVLHCVALLAQSTRNGAECKTIVKLSSAESTTLFDNGGGGGGYVPTLREIHPCRTGTARRAVRWSCKRLFLC
ncbi:hypothetical protein PF005_g18877 [Phytophthora fragariae]|uniref:Secreted protein n=1 Tax=Phytophthora fragariae TaxID=53985 RepID=A0A6A3WY79_9STRA|nr:hypothetical protein PF005_g18877 [Phytophthora fragariae]